MSKLRRTTKDLLSLGVLFTVLWSFVWTFAAPENIPVYFVAILIPFLLMYAIRRLAKKDYVYYILTLGVCLVSWFFLRSIWTSEAILAFLAVSLIHSVYAWRNDEVQPGIGRCVFYYAVLVFLYYLVFREEDAHIFLTRYIICFLVITSFAIIYHQMNNLDVKLHLDKSKNHDAAKRMARINNIMSLIFVGFISVAGVFAVFFPVNMVFRSIARFFSWFASILSLGLPFLWKWLTRLGDVDVPFRGTPGIQIGEVQAMEGRILVAVLEVMGILVFIAAIVFVLYYIVRKVKRFKRAAKTAVLHEEVELSGSIFDDLRDLMPKFTKFRHPIRRAYEKKVNTHIKQGIKIDRKDTTDAIAKKIRKAEDIDELTAKYEVVRYGGK